MNDASLFLCGVGVTLLASLTALAYLRPHLKAILTDLCGGPERADFWTAFSNITISLVPLIFAMHYRPDPEERVSGIFELGRQLEWSLAGLVLSVVILGIVIGRFIPPLYARVAAGQERKAA